MFSLQTLAALTLGTTMMFEAWGYMLPQQNPTDLLILVNKTNKAPAVPVTLVKPNVQPTRGSASENIYMRPEAAAALEALFAGAAEDGLTRILASYCGRIKVHCVNLLGIQEAIGENCPEDEMTILSRRFMMMIAERIARDNGCDMLITGENIGQVASQTAQGLVVTDNAVSMPVMRPLIAMDKVDIMDLAQKVGTYETSIQPFEDCCTVFLPKHPVTKPRLENILKSESVLD